MNNPRNSAIIVDRNGGLAQLGERALHRGDVAGSSPVFSTISETRIVRSFLCVSFRTKMVYDFSR